MPITPQARRRLAEMMEERRLNLALRWQDVAEAGRISLKTLHSVRTGDAGIAALTKRAVETGLRWRPGSVDQILAGGNPVPAEGSPAHPRENDSPATFMDADPDELAPYLAEVEREIAEAIAKHGPEVTGEQIGSFSEQERALWDESPLPRPKRAAAVAALRMLVDEALHPGARRAMLARPTRQYVTKRLQRVILLLSALVPPLAQGRDFPGVP